MGVELGLALIEECRLRMFENRIVRMIFGPKKDEMTKEWIGLLQEEFVICIPNQILFGLLNQE
jgi:hypothetical protein